MDEIWLPVVGYGNSYSVSNTGLVMRTAPKQLAHRRCDPWANFKPSPIRSYKNRGGYLQVRIGHSGAQKTVCVHSLVANAFVSNPNGLREVNHKDGNKLNNCDCNLEWVTRSTNIIHAIALGLQPVLRGESHGNAKLSDDAVRAIRLSSETAKKLAETYSVSRDLIYYIRKRKGWLHVE